MLRFNRSDTEKEEKTSHCVCVFVSTAECVCVSVSSCLCVYVCVSLTLWLCVYSCVSLCLCAFVSMYMCVCVSLCLPVSASVCLCLCVVFDQISHRGCSFHLCVSVSASAAHSPPSELWLRLVGDDLTNWPFTADIMP